MAEINRATQAGLNVLASEDVDIRATQAGFNVLLKDASPLRATQAGLNVLANTPRPTLVAETLSDTSIRLTMLAGVGAASHTLHRSQTEGFTPGAGNQIGSWVGAPPATLDDTGLNPGEEYFYALVGDAGGGVTGTARASAETVGYGTTPTLRVGSITDASAVLAVDPLVLYLEVRFETRQLGVVVDDTYQTGPSRFYRFLYGLPSLTTYESRAKVRFAAGWSSWSNTVQWNTQAPGYYDPNALGCPPGSPGVYVNPDANPPDNRLGTGFFTPHPGQPMRGVAQPIVFRWTSQDPIWDFYLSDDLGETWTLIRNAVAWSGNFDNDALRLWQFTLDTTLYADGMDYRLKAVSTNTADADVVSLSFPIDNGEEVYWWKATYADQGDRWGKAWAQEGEKLNGTPTGDGIWKHGFDGCLAALAGHQHAALIDRTIPLSLGGDVTIRFYIWSGEGGLFQLQGRDDTEGIQAGIAFFANGASTATAQGMFVAVANLITEALDCCNGFLVSNGAGLGRAFAVTAGGGFSPSTIGAGDFEDAIDKMWFKSLSLPRAHGLPIERLILWPYMTWRNGPEPGDDLKLKRFTCARRWEQYALRCRVERDPVDFKKVRIRTRLDGLGVAEPSSGYWHGDEEHTADADFEAGSLGFFSWQLAQELYGTASGARVFISWSALPFEPSTPPLIPPTTLPPWNPPEPGEPCTLVLQHFAEDRKRVKWEVGTDTYHSNPYLCLPEHYGEQEIDVVNGAASIGQVEVVLIDKNVIPGDQDSGWLTRRLPIGSVGGIHGRRNRLIRYIDYDLGWVVIADGPASTPFMDDYAAYRWTIRDTRETERKVRAFVKADTSWILPMGVPAGFGAYEDENGASQWLIEPTDPLVGPYSYDPLDAFPVGTVNLGAYWDNYPFGPFPPSGPVDEAIVITDPVEKEAIAEVDLLGDPGPILWTWPTLEILWRVQGSGDPWTVVQPTDLLVAGRSIVKPAGTAGYYRTLFTIFDGTLDGDAVRAAYGLMIRGYQAEGTFPNDGDTLEVAVRYAGEPTDAFPLHIEGLTAGEFLKKLYDGEYSDPDPLTGEVVPTGIRYNEPDLLEVNGAPESITLNGVGGELTLPTNVEHLLVGSDPYPEHEILLRITEPVDDLRDWTEKHLYAPTGWVAALNNDAEISPRSQIPPISFAGLVDVANAITEPRPNWDAGERIVNVLTFTYPRWYPVEVTETDAVDGLAERTVIREWRDEASITRHGVQSVNLDGSAFSAIGDIYGKAIVSGESELGYQLAQLRRYYVFDRYRNGAPAMTVPVRRDFTSQLRAGDWVTVNLSWFPDYVTRRRGLITGCQILSIRDEDCEWRTLLIEEALPIVPES